MENAGLTRGGFYRHFRDKDELYAEAVRRFLCTDAPKPWQPNPTHPTRPRGQRVVDAYFSRDHFDDRETCCPLIALPSDVMRGSDAVKAAYREVLQKLVEIFLNDLDEPQRHERALALAALCVGGIVTPKCVDDPVLADNLRRAAYRQALHIGGWTVPTSRRQRTMSQGRRSPSRLHPGRHANRIAKLVLAKRKCLLLAQSESGHPKALNQCPHLVGKADVRGSKRTSMKQAFEIEIPRTLEDVCNARHLALLVYDMQVGIKRQVKEGKVITAKIREILEAARIAKVRVFFTRHMSLPKELMGAFQFRMAMAWQRVDDPEKVQPWFLRDTPGFAIVPELQPLPSEAIFDKLAMSAFEGTPLAFALRDCGIKAVAVVGIAMEVGIEPTVRHAADLGFVPVVISDACGAGDSDAAKRSFDSLAFAGDTLFTDTKTFCGLIRRAG